MILVVPRSRRSTEELLEGGGIMLMGSWTATALTIKKYILVKPETWARKAS